MGARGTWSRAVVRASATALVVPVGLIVAVLVAAGVGGGSISRLDQLVDGPRLPAGSSPAGGDESTSRNDAGLPSLPRRAASADRRPAHASSRPSSPAAAADPSPGARDPRRPTAAVPGRRPARPVTTGSAPDPAPAAAATTPAAPSPVQEAGDAASGMVEGVPVVGGQVPDAMDTVVDLVAPRSVAPAGR